MLGICLLFVCFLYSHLNVLEYKNGVCVLQAFICFCCLTRCLTLQTFDFTVCFGKGYDLQVGSKHQQKMNCLKFMLLSEVLSEDPCY